jgi:uncharacterized membrane protein YgcG
MLDAGIPLQFPEEKPDPATEQLGMASRSQDTKKMARPYIPVLSFLQSYIAKIQKTKGKDRVKWVERSFPAPPQMEAQFLRPAPIPSSCWQAMTDDSFTWCVPDKTAPPGVEGGSTAAAKPQKPHKVFPWNQERDAELRNLEALARDGLRLANASLLTFAHIMNGVIDPAKTLSPEAHKRSLFTLRDLQYVNAEHYARLSHRLAMLRKLNACRALNLLNPEPFMKTPIGPDLFGGQWESLHTEDLKRRKDRALLQKEKQDKRKAQSKEKQSALRASQPRFFRKDRDDKQSSSQQWKQDNKSSGYSGNKKNNQSDKKSGQSYKGNKKGSGDNKKSGGGGGRGGRGGKGSYHRHK